MAAVRQNRVMTLNQETVGNRKDFGLVGFHPGKHASYLIFPKPLSAFNGQRMGIKYDFAAKSSADRAASRTIKDRSGWAFQTWD